MSAAYRQLTREDIIETVGEKTLLESVEALEILFTSFDEIGALEYCRSLHTLTMLDNGLKKISNLAPISQTLRSLCLCDQSITKMENLVLPNLRELYLHRNKILKIENLQYCPKIRKLWLFQNNLTSMSGLHALPELTECWLQGNMIEKLNGLEHNQQLRDLGLAGNRISDFSELKRLIPIKSLSTLSLNDIHFGHCIVTELNGYREFILCFLLQIRVLDGVVIGKGDQSNAVNAYNDQVRAFNDSLQEVEDDFRKDLQEIDNHQQNQQNHFRILEQEMSNALLELQGLVQDGRNYIGKELAKHRHIMDSNSKSLEMNLKNLTLEYSQKLEENTKVLSNEYDLTASLFYMLERYLSAEEELVSVLCLASEALRNEHNNKNDVKRKYFAFQSLGVSTPDYLMMRSIINNDNYNNGYDDINNDNSKKKSNRSNSDQSNDDDDDIELVKLYRIYSPSNSNPSIPASLPDNYNNYSNFYNGKNSNGYDDINNDRNSKNCKDVRVFTVLTITQFDKILKMRHGPYSNPKDKSSNPKDDVIIFSSTASLAMTFFNLKAENNNENDNGNKRVDKNGNEDEILRADRNRGSFVNVVNVDEGDINPNPKSSPLLTAAVKNDILLLLSCSSYSVDKLNRTEELTLPLLLSEKQSLFDNINYNDTEAVLAYSIKNSKSYIFVTNLRCFKNSKGNNVEEALPCITLEFACICVRPPTPSPSGNDDSNGSSSTNPRNMNNVNDNRPKNNSGSRKEKERERENSSSSSTSNKDISNPHISSLKSIEYRLELLMVPTRHTDRNVYLLAEFQKKLDAIVKNYVDQLLEEVTESQAQNLRKADSDILCKENSLIDIREEIEKERRTQENLLKEMKQYHSAESSNSDKSNNNKTRR